MVLENQKFLFNIPEDITYLNCANMAPLLKSVKKAGVQSINRRNQPWNIKVDDWFNPAEELRALFAQIIKSKPENIALIPSVSYGIAVAAKNISLKQGKKILILDQQYPSNVYAWQELSRTFKAEIITVRKETNKDWTESILQSIDKKTAITAIPNCHWTDGSLIDLELISQKTREVGSKLVVDASQSLGAYPLYIDKIKPDFLVSVGYKWLIGPYHQAYLYVDPEYHDHGVPLEYTWLSKLGSEDFTQLVNYTDLFKPGARRFDAGEFPGFIQIPMATAALTQILKWKVANIQQTLKELTCHFESVAKEFGYKIPGVSRVDHMIGVELTTDQTEKLKYDLTKNKIHVSFRGTNMRIAPHLYNTVSDMDKLLGFLERIKH